MSLEFACGSLLWASADAATTVYTISGLTFQPKAIRLYCSGRGSLIFGGDNATNERRCVGFGTSTTDRRCVCTFDQDGANTMVCATGYTATAILATVSSTPALDGLLDLNSITSDGFTLIVDDAAPVNIAVYWEAWGGSDITSVATGEISEPATATAVDYVVTGSFQPTVVMFAGVQGTASPPTATRNDSGFYAGFATGSAAANNVVVLGNSDDAIGTSDTDGYGRAGDCVAMILIAGGNPNARAHLTAFNADGFELTWDLRAVTGRKSIYLAIAGGSNWQAGSFTIDNTANGNLATVSGLSFQPNGLSFISRYRAEDAAATATAPDSTSFGSAAATNQQVSTSVESADASGLAAIGVQGSPTGCMVGREGAGAWTGNEVLDAIYRDGFRIKVAGAANTSAVQWIGYLASGNAPVTYPPSVNTVVKDAVHHSHSW